MLHAVQAERSIKYMPIWTQFRLILGYFYIFVTFFFLLVWRKEGQSVKDTLQVGG